MSANFVALMIVTATFFALSRVRQTSQLSVFGAAGYAVGAIFVLQRVIELITFGLGQLATDANYTLPWGELLTVSTLGVLALQYVVAVIILALLYRYDQAVIAWVAILVIGSLGFIRLLV